MQDVLKFVSNWCGLGGNAPSYSFKWTLWPYLCEIYLAWYFSIVSWFFLLVFNSQYHWTLLLDMIWGQSGTRHGQKELAWINVSQVLVPTLAQLIDLEPTEDSLADFLVSQAVPGVQIWPFLRLKLDCPVRHITPQCIGEHDFGTFWSGGCWLYPLIGVPVQHQEKKVGWESWKGQTEYDEAPVGCKGSRAAHYKRL